MPPLHLFLVSLKSYFYKIKQLKDSQGNLGRMILQNMRDPEWIEQMGVECQRCRVQGTEENTVVQLSREQTVLSGEGLSHLWVSFCCLPSTMQESSIYPRVLEQILCSSGYCNLDIEMHSMITRVSLMNISMCSRLSDLQFSAS